ncbi:hypothetical protein M0R45_008713 [Rubus argutus]|uniref:Peptidase A2 domain-containing protein n=1 Tax=Rubus argutus TaxID=59490 RepID=A0AAW1Y4I5_RUBAR
MTKVEEALLSELTLSEEDYLAKPCMGRSLKAMFQARRESSCPAVRPSVDTSSLPLSERDLSYLREYHQSYLAEKLYGLTQKEEALANAFDKHTAEKKKRANQSSCASKPNAEAKNVTPDDQPKVEVLRNKLPPFSAKDWATMNEFHKTHSALALYGPTWEELDTLKALAENPDLEPIMVPSTASAGLKILYQAKLDGLDSEVDTSKLPISQRDLKYLRKYHKMYYVVSTYGIIHQEKELLDKMNARIQQREAEYAAYAAEQDEEDSGFEFGEEPKAMVTDCDEVIQAITSIMAGDEIDQTQVEEGQFKIEEEHEMVEVKEEVIKNSIDTFPEVQSCDEETDLVLTRMDLPLASSALTISTKEAKAEVDMVYVLPIDFLAQPNQPNAMEGDVEDKILPRILIEEPSQAYFLKLTPDMVRHIKPLYITACFEGYPISKVLVDGGAAVNVIPMSVVTRLKKAEKDILLAHLAVYDFSGNKKKTMGVIPLEVTVGSKGIVTGFYVISAETTYNAILGRDWIHKHMCIPSTLHQLLIFWNGDEVEVVKADKPFKATANVVEAAYYDELVGPSEIQREDNSGRITGITMRRMITLGAETVLEDSERPALAKLFDSVINE